MFTNFPELNDLCALEKFNLPNVKFQLLDTIKVGDKEFPIKSIIIGPDDKTLPTFGLFGGVHGLEKVGSQVIISFFNSLLFQMTWDKDLCRSLDGCRIVSIPIINPGGMASSSRCNPRNVDLMRNAPVEADKAHITPLISGHRISPLLPWYRGNEGEGFEKEAAILIDFVKTQMLSSKMSIALDVHSGFGVRDQIWYPYARTRTDFPLKSEALKLKALLDQSLPHHIYKFESQSVNYLTHGDLWDYLFDECWNKAKKENAVFLPLTLELGSWNWIKKNPMQFFSKLGLFHPIKQHRHSRIMRRHILLLDFLTRAIRNHHSWR